MTDTSASATAAPRAGRVRLGSLGDRLADDLRSRVIRGDLPRGTRLPEDGLAAEYDVSRGPVRDALKVLAAEQLIDLGRVGAVVRGVGPEEVDELYALRGAIEPLALESAMRAAVDTDTDAWAEAVEQVEAMAHAAETRQWEAYAEHDLRFHSVAFSRSGNSRLQAVWDRYRPTFRVMMQMTVAQDSDLRPSARAHAALLDVVRGGDLEAARRTLDDHLDGARRRMLAAVRAHSAGLRSAPRG